MRIWLTDGVPIGADWDPRDSLVFPFNSIQWHRNGGCRFDVDAHSGVTKDGFVSYWFANDSDGNRLAADVSMYFDTTGEFWILHGSGIYEADPTRRFMALTQVFDGWATALRRTQWLFDAFGALPARRVELGFTGVENVKFPGRWNILSPPAIRDGFKIDRMARTWSDPAAQEALLIEAFHEVFELFGLDRRSDADAVDFVRKNDRERERKNPYG